MFLIHSAAVLGRTDSLQEKGIGDRTVRAVRVQRCAKPIAGVSLRVGCNIVGLTGDECCCIIGEGGLVMFCRAAQRREFGDLAGWMRTAPSTRCADTTLGACRHQYCTRSGGLTGGCLAKAGQRSCRAQGGHTWCRCMPTDDQWRLYAGS